MDNQSLISEISALSKKSGYQVKTYVVKARSDAECVDILDQCSGCHAMYLYSLAGNDNPEKVKMRYETIKNRREVDKLHKRNVSLIRKSHVLLVQDKDSRKPANIVEDTLYNQSTDNLMNNLETYGKMSDNFSDTNANPISQDSFNLMVTELKKSLEKSRKNDKALDSSEAILTKLEELERTVLNMNPGGNYHMTHYQHSSSNTNYSGKGNHGYTQTTTFGNNDESLGSTCPHGSDLNPRMSIGSELKRKIEAIKQSRKYEMPEDVVEQRISDLKSESDPLAISESSIGSISMSQMTGISQGNGHSYSKSYSRPTSIAEKQLSDIEWAQRLRFEDLDEDNQFLVSVLRTTEPFNKMDFISQLYMAATADKFEADKNGYITTAGQVSKEFFILDNGEVEILSADGNRSHGTLKKGTAFGVDSCLKKLNRNVSVVTNVNSLFWAISYENIPMEGNQIDLGQLRQTITALTQNINALNGNTQDNQERPRQLSAIQEVTEEVKYSNFGSDRVIPQQPPSISSASNHTSSLDQSSIKAANTRYDKIVEEEVNKGDRSKTKSRSRSSSSSSSSTSNTSSKEGSKIISGQNSKSESKESGINYNQSVQYNVHDMYSKDLPSNDHDSSHSSSSHNQPAMIRQSSVSHPQEIDMISLQNSMTSLNITYNDQTRQEETRKSRSSKSSAKTSKQAESRSSRSSSSSSSSSSTSSLNPNDSASNTSLNKIENLKEIQFDNC